MNGSAFLRAIPLAAALAVACPSSAGPERGPGAPAPRSDAEEIVFSSYLGGRWHDNVRDMTFDAEGNLYTAGGTGSPDFDDEASPVHWVSESASGWRRLLPARRAPSTDIALAKFAPDGRLLWRRRLGGPGHDRAYAVEVDAAGFVYIAGRAGEGLPVTAGALQPEFRGSPDYPPYGPQDGFVCKLEPDGTTVVFCTYFGTSDGNPVRDLALAPDGDLYLASGWNEGEWPPAIAAAFRNRPAGAPDAVFARLAGDGSRLRWATYLGGPGWESHENSVALDGRGRPHVLFTTESPGIASEGAYDTRYAGDQDVFVARLDPTSGAVVWGSYLGGPGNESTETHELAVTREGRAVVAVPTKSRELETTPGAVQPAYAGGGNEMLIAVLSEDGARLRAATYLGGSGMDQPEGVAVDPAGNVHVSGASSSPDFPVTGDAAQTAPPAEANAVALVLSADLTQLFYSSFLGGSGTDVARAAAVSRDGGRFALASQTDSDDWPVRNAAQDHYGGGVLDSNVTVFGLGAR